MKYLKILIFTGIVLPAFLVSCTKADLAKNNSPVDSTTIMGFKDSSLLIRSLHIVMYDTTMENVMDTLTYYYFFDTLNKKTGVFLHPPSNGSDPDYYVVLSYDASGWLTRLQYNPVYFSNPGDLSFVDYAYDDQHVIKSELGTFTDHTENKVIAKTISGAGYALDWRTANDQGDSIQNHIQFDVNGRIANYSYRSLAGPAGEGYLDSLFYDAGDNIVKQTETYLDDAYDTSTYNLYEYTRDTKGNQFYNFIQAIYHGIANLPLGIGDQFSDPYNYLNQQTKFPATQTIAHHQDDLGNPYFLTFTSPNQFDSQNRLIRTTLFADDIKLYPVVMTISYYK